MLRCPETHEEAFLVMSTGEMVGRMVRSGILGCPVCRREFPIMKGVVQFSAGEGAPLPGKNKQLPRGGPPPPEAHTPHALLALRGPRRFAGVGGPAGGAAGGGAPGGGGGVLP